MNFCKSTSSWSATGSVETGADGTVIAKQPSYEQQWRVEIAFT